MKRYEKNALLRFFGLFLGAFMLMFFLLATLYYTQESSRLSKELEITSKMNYIECMKLGMDTCSQEHNIDPNLDALHQDILYAFGLVLLIFIPISLGLSLFSIKPVRQASTMIDNFIANIVHDINTPIATIMLNTKSLMKKSQGEPKKIKRILSSAQQLSDMQHDLLALANEKSQIEKESIDVKELIQEVVGDLKLQYKAQPFDVDLKAQKVEVNGVDMRRIIQNLLSNAIKYNKENNPIKIYIQNNALVIEDQGKGMKEPQKVFEKNYREDYTIQGSGLGLASVLAMLQRNQISIEVKSQLNVGTKIILNFH